VCFDSGGLDIKTAEGMRLMKKDMGGAARRARTRAAHHAAQAPIRLHCLVPTVENAISGNAYRPGDVVRTRKGLNVEIGNTDAEGRVILCDALAYAVERSRAPSSTSRRSRARRAWRSARAAGAFCNDEKLAARCWRAPWSADDPMWRLPLWRNYRRLFDSDIADFNNSGRGGFGGAIVAALFLDYFVPQDIAWAHFDVFAWNDASRPGRPLSWGERRDCARSRGAHVMKKGLIVAAVIMAIVAGAGFFVWNRLDIIVKVALEHYGPDVTGVSVTVGDVEISPHDGRGRLRNLEIGNPPGFTASRSARFGDVILEIDPATLRSPVVHVRAIGVDAPTIVYERGDKTTPRRSSRRTSRSIRSARATRTAARACRGRSGASSSTGCSSAARRSR
jgi:hypothetical protein